MLQRQVQHTARIIECLHTGVGLAGVAQRAHAVASQVEGHGVGILDLVAFPTEGEDTRRCSVALGAQAVGQVVNAHIRGAQELVEVQLLPQPRRLAEGDDRLLRCSGDFRAGRVGVFEAADGVPGIADIQSKGDHALVGVVDGIGGKT